jgi:hypothetical protein
MQQNTNLTESEMERQTIPTDTAEIPKLSPWDEFLLELKFVGFALAILGLILGINYLQSR